jgi:hypothetical protein
VRPPVAPEKDKPVAGIHQQGPDPSHFRQEGEARVDVQRHGSHCQVDETETETETETDTVQFIAVNLGDLERLDKQSLHGVAEPLTVVRVGDEVAPGLGHALEPADGLGRASMPPSKSNL